MPMPKILADSHFLRTGSKGARPLTSDPKLFERLGKSGGQPFDVRVVVINLTGHPNGPSIGVRSRPPTNHRNLVVIFLAENQLEPLPHLKVGDQIVDWKRNHRSDHRIWSRRLDPENGAQHLAK